MHETQEEEFIRLARAANADRGAPIPDALLHRKNAESDLTFGGKHGAMLREDPPMRKRPLRADFYGPYFLLVATRAQRKIRDWPDTGSN